MEYIGIKYKHLDEYLQNCYDSCFAYERILQTVVKC